MILSSKKKGFSANPSAPVLLGLFLASACSTTGGDQTRGRAQSCANTSDTTECHPDFGEIKPPQSKESRPKKTAHSSKAVTPRYQTEEELSLHNAPTSPFDPTGQVECTLQPSPVFPGQFDAVQVVEFSRGPEAARQRKWLLAILKRRPSSLRVSMADAVLQTPLADLEIQNGKITSETHFGSTEDQREPISELALSLDRFYGTSNLNCQGQKVLFTDRVVDLVAQSWDKFPACLFPQKISVKVLGSGTLRVEVRTEEVTCSDAR